MGGFFDMQVVDYEQMERATRRVVAGKNLMLVYVEREAGSVRAEHSHPNEQIIYLLEGRAKFRLGDEEREVEAGQAMHVEPDLVHQVDALTDIRYLGIYSPPREEIISGKEG
ncbi:cupin domain-containing protein [Nitrospinota bacterium]